MTSRLMETCSPSGVHSLSPEDEEDIKGVAGTMYAGEHPTIHSSFPSPLLLILKKQQAAEDTVSLTISIVTLHWTRL